MTGFVCGSRGEVEDLGDLYPSEAGLFPLDHCGHCTPGVGGTATRGQSTDFHPLKIENAVAENIVREMF